MNDSNRHRHRILEVGSLDPVYRISDSKNLEGVSNSCQRNGAREPCSKKANQSTAVQRQLQNSPRNRSFENLKS